MNRIILLVIFLASGLSSSSIGVLLTFLICFAIFSWSYPLDMKDLTSHSMLLLYSSLSEQIILFLSAWL